jgi:uncharacterized membrane protein
VALSSDPGGQRADSWLGRVYREVDAAASRADRAEPVARRALLGGVIASATLLLAGLILAFVQHEPRPDHPPNILEMFRGLGGCRGVCLVYLGLLTLAATPILRVGVMISIYARRREWFMAAVSVTVLALLAIGLILGTG